MLTRLGATLPLAVALGGLLLGPLVSLPLAGRDVVVDGADVAAGVLAAWAVIAAATGRRPVRWEAAALPAAGVVVVAALQVLLLGGGAEVVTGAVRFAAVAVLALALRVLLPVEPPTDWPLVVGAFGAAVAVGVLLDVVPAVAAADGFYAVKNAVVQPLGASNYLAGFLLVSLLVTAAVAVSRRTPVAVGLAVLSALGLAGTLSRAAAAALAATLLVAVLLRLDRRLGLVAGGAAVVGVAALPLVAAAVPRLGAMPGVSALLHRQDQFAAAWQAFTAQPVLGVGLNRYQEAVSLGLAQPHDHAHNLLLHDLAEIGLLGTAVHLAIWVLLLRRVARLPAGPTRWGLGLAGLALFLHAQLEALTSTQPVEVLLVVLAVVAGTAGSTAARPAPAAPASTATPAPDRVAPGVRSAGRHRPE